jgi:2-methylcitrate dehydratase PrpD
VIILPTVSEQLADWAGTLTYESIPSEYIESARENILDMIGCGLFGSALPWVRTVSDMVVDWGGKPESTLWGRNVKVPSVNSVFANTNAANSFEFDDTYFPTGIHPGALVVSSALATAEYTGHGTGKQLIAAVVAGHEISARIRSGLGWSVLHGWNGTAICSTFGAAVSSAKMLGLPPDKIADAIGIAGPYVGGLLTYGFKAGAKRIVNARSGQGGILAAMLAEKGVTGYRDFIESKQGGFISAHSSDPTTEKVTENLGTDYLFKNMALKKYPNCTSFHAVLDALYEITGTDPVDIDSLDRIIVNTTTGAQKNDVGTTYDNVHSAQMSMPYAVAAKILDGVVGVNQFSESMIQNLDIRRIAERVEILVDADLDSRGLDHRLAAKVDLVMKSGEVLESSIVRNPRRMTNDEVRAKFYNLSGHVVDKARSDEIMKFIDRLESQENINSLSELLAV